MKQEEESAVCSDSGLLIHTSQFSFIDTDYRHMICLGFVHVGLFCIFPPTFHRWLT